MHVLKENAIEPWKHPVIQCFCDNPNEIPALSSILDICGISYRVNADCLEFELENRKVDIEEFLKAFCRLKDFSFCFDDTV